MNVVHSKLINVLRKCGLGNLTDLVIEPISLTTRNITLGFNAQDWADDDNNIIAHSFTIGIFFIRITFNFDYE